MQFNEGDRHNRDNDLERLFDQFENSEEIIFSSNLRYFAFLLADLFIPGYTAQSAKDEYYRSGNNPSIVDSFQEAFADPNLEKSLVKVLTDHLLQQLKDVLEIFINEFSKKSTSPSRYSNKFINFLSKFVIFIRESSESLLYINFLDDKDSEEKYKLFAIFKQAISSLHNLIPNTHSITSTQLRELTNKVELVLDELSSTLDSIEPNRETHFLPKWVLFEHESTKGSKFSIRIELDIEIGELIFIQTFLDQGKEVSNVLSLSKLQQSIRNPDEEGVTIYEEVISLEGDESQDKATEYHNISNEEVIDYLVNLITILIINNPELYKLYIKEIQQENIIFDEINMPKFLVWIFDQHERLTNS